MAFSRDGKFLATGGDDKTVKVWDAGTHQVVHSLTGHTGAIFGVAFHPTEPGVLATSHDSFIKLWNYRTGEHLATLEGHDNIVKALAFSSDGLRLALNVGAMLVASSRAYPNISKEEWLTSTIRPWSVMAIPSKAARPKSIVRSRGGRPLSSSASRLKRNRKTAPVLAPAAVIAAKGFCGSEQVCPCGWMAMVTTLL